MKLWVAIALAAALVAGGVAFAYFSPEPSYSDEELAAFGFTALPEPAQVGDFELADARGGSFDPARFEGRWSFVFFGYANCPDICPTTMAVLGDAERLLLASGDAAFQGILVSVDPERDTPEALAGYVGAFSENFIGVTGTSARVMQLARRLHAGFARVPVEESALGYLMDHSSHLVVIAPDGRYYGFVKPPFDARQLASLSRALNHRWAAGPAKAEA